MFHSCVVYAASVWLMCWTCQSDGLTWHPARFLGIFQHVPDPVTPDFPSLLPLLLLTLVPTFPSTCQLTEVVMPRARENDVKPLIYGARLITPSCSEGIMLEAKCVVKHIHSSPGKHKDEQSFISSRCQDFYCHFLSSPSHLLSELDSLSLHWSYVSSSFVTSAWHYLPFVKSMGRIMKLPFVCALWPGGENWLNFHRQRACVFSSAKSGPRRPPPHWACDCPRGADPSFPVFLWLCREFSIDLLALLHGFILPPSSTSSSLIPAWRPWPPLWCFPL